MSQIGSISFVKRKAARAISAPIVSEDGNEESIYRNFTIRESSVGCLENPTLLSSASLENRMKLNVLPSLKLLQVIFCYAKIQKQHGNFTNKDRMVHTLR